MAKTETQHKPPQDSLPALIHLSDLLHLFHHRNKNQHRHSIWWRHFSTFRKQVNHLVTDMTTLVSVPTTNLAKTKKKREDTKILATHASRMEFWTHVMVAKWQRAFSQLIADGRFAVLGLVLMAMLAELCTTVGVTAELEELGQMDVEKVLEEFAREEWAEGGAVQNAAREDVGEVVQREPDLESSEPTVSVSGNQNGSSKHQEELLGSSAPTKKRPAEAGEKRTKKKRKKTGNAIDDIFG